MNNLHYVASCICIFVLLASYIVLWTVLPADYDVHLYESIVDGDDDDDDDDDENDIYDYISM